MSDTIRCEQAMLVIARAQQGLRETLDIMLKPPLSLEKDDPFCLLFVAAIAACGQTVELEGSPEISRAVRMRLYQERDLIDSLPPLRVECEG